MQKYFVFGFMFFLAACKGDNVWFDTASPKEDATSSLQGVVTLTIDIVNGGNAKYVTGGAFSHKDVGVDLLDVGEQPVTRIGIGNDNMLRWEATDKVHLVVVQDGKAYYQDAGVSIDPLSTHIATVRFSQPEVNFNRPYKLYGFFGNGSWKRQGDVHPQVMLPAHGQVYSTLADAVKQLSFVFGGEHEGGTSPRVSARMVGNVWRYKLKNTLQNEVRYKSLELRSSDGNIVYPTSAVLSIDPQTGLPTQTPVSQSTYIPSEPIVLSQGDVFTGYFYSIASAEAPQKHAQLGVITQEDNTFLSCDFLMPFPSKGLRTITAFLCQSGLYKQSGPKPQKLSSADELDNRLNNWMSLYPDNFPLLKMLIPGTHDTEAVFFTGLTGSVAAGLGQCQAHHIKEQLEKGVRAVDIRLRPWYGKELYVAHGVLNTEVELSKHILPDMVNFLKNNPSETIFMMVKDENTADGYLQQWSDLFSQAINNPEFRSYFGPSVNVDTKLGEVRGKIILMTRINMAKYRPEFNVGLRFNVWAENSRHQVPCVPYIGTTSAEPRVTVVEVQDIYSGIPITKKVELAQNTLYTSVDNSFTQTWTINYTSLSGNPGQNAAEINPEMVKFLEQSQIPFSGIVYTDFITRIRYAQGPQLMRALLWNPIKNLND